MIIDFWVSVCGYLLLNLLFIHTPSPCQVFDTILNKCSLHCEGATAMEPMKLNAHRQPTAMTMSQQVWTFEHYAYLFPNDDQEGFVKCSMALVHPFSFLLVGTC